MGKVELKRDEIVSGPVLDALELLQVYGVPLKRVFSHPSFRLAMRSVVLSEGGDPDEFLGLQVAPHTRLSLVEIELESIGMDLARAKGSYVSRLGIRGAREEVGKALRAMGERAEEGSD